jgi:error-prone DNA polymerase
VCGLVIVRQRPGSAKGVTFATLEDETGVANVVIWRKLYEARRRVVLAARLMRATGRIQRDGDVIHVVAEEIEDLSQLLDQLSHAPRFGDAALAPADEGRRPQPDGARGQGGGAAARAQGLIRGAAPRATHPREQAKRLFRDAPED